MYFYQFLSKWFYIVNFYLCRPHINWFFVISYNTSSNRTWSTAASFVRVHVYLATRFVCMRKCDIYCMIYIMKFPWLNAIWLQNGFSSKCNGFHANFARCVHNTALAIHQLFAFAINYSAFAQLWRNPRIIWMELPECGRLFREHTSVCVQRNGALQAQFVDNSPK